MESTSSWSSWFVENDNFLEQEGVLEDIRYVGERDSYIYDLTFFVRPGSEVKRFANSSHCLAQIVVEGQNLEECERKVDLVTSKIEMRLK